MEKYLCGKAALSYWKVPDIRGVLEPKNARFTREYVVFTAESLYRPAASNIHTCSIKGAEKYVKNGVCTLPLLFLRLASVYSIHQLIVLGLMICSWNNGKPLCTIRELQECANELKGHRGRRKALRAIKYLQESSRSAREDMVYILVRLPHAMGGCGLSEAIFNYKIEGVSPSGEKFTYYADVYIPSKRLVIEYDSFKYHNNSTSFSEDMIRTSNLTALGYRVIHIKPAQLENRMHLETLLRNILKLVGKRIRIRARKFFEGFKTIWNLINKHGEESSDRYDTVRLSEVPQFPGVRKAYKQYIQALQLFRQYPKGPLTLSRIT